MRFLEEFRMKYPKNLMMAGHKCLTALILQDIEVVEDISLVLPKLKNH